MISSTIVREIDGSRESKICIRIDNNFCVVREANAHSRRKNWVARIPPIITPSYWSLIIVKWSSELLPPDSCLHWCFCDWFDIGWKRYEIYSFHYSPSLDRDFLSHICEHGLNYDFNLNLWSRSFDRSDVLLRGEPMGGWNSKDVNGFVNGGRSSLASWIKHWIKNGNIKM